MMQMTSIGAFDISSLTPDGVYVQESETIKDLYQIVVIGPMVNIPGEYCEELRSRTGKDLQIISLGAMSCERPEKEAEVRRRGFWTIRIGVLQ